MWNIHGVLPPIAENESGHSTNRSPYQISIIEFVSRFNFSAERKEILLSFLSYRRELYSKGVTQGFQWIDGSFVEDVEVIRECPPNDIDIVTFANLSKTIPDIEQWTKDNLHLLHSSLAKEQYNVDAYWVDLDLGLTEYTIKLCAYWYSMWSHQKNTNIWKGFYNIRLSPEEDKEAIAYLSNLEVDTNHA